MKIMKSAASSLSRFSRGTWMGQSMVEMAIVIPLIILLTLGTVSMSMFAYQRASFDHALNTAGFDLPDNWRELDKTTLVHDLLSQAPELDPERIRVDEVSMEVSTDTNHSGTPDAYGTETVSTLLIKATVSYDFEQLLPIGGGDDIVTSTFARTFTIERGFETL